MKTSFLTLLFILSPLLNAQENETHIHAYYEVRDFKNSLQKTEGRNKVLELQQKLKQHTLKVAYERTDATTTPAIPKDLNVKKMFARYTYTLNKKWKAYAGYIYIDDNLVSTDGGKIYSLGINYKSSPSLLFSLSSYYGDYDIMKTYQVDTKMTYIRQFWKVKSMSSLDVKQIFIKDCQERQICSNAQSYYITPGVKQVLSYQGNYLKLGAFFGKRTFAIMHEGFRVQHHAMEFNRTYLASIGKKFKGFDLAIAYIYQEAEELPMHNKGVEVRNTIFSVAYTF